MLKGIEACYFSKDENTYIRFSTRLAYVINDRTKQIIKREKIGKERETKWAHPTVGGGANRLRDHGQKSDNSITNTPESSLLVLTMVSHTTTQYKLFHSLRKFDLVVLQWKRNEIRFEQIH